MPKFRIVVLLVAIAFFTPVFALAQELVTDRPDQTESSVTVPKGSLQIESGLLFSEWDENSITVKQNLLPTTLFRYGLTKNIEIRLVVQNEKLITASDKIKGLSDIEAGTKIQVLKEENGNTEIAFLAHVFVPTGNEALSNGKWGMVSKFAFSNPVNDYAGIGYNLGYSYFGMDKGSITYSFAAGFSITDKISIYFEPFGEIYNFESLFVNTDAGITYLLRKNFQLDFSLGTGINYKTNYIAVGFSWRIPG